MSEATLVVRARALVARELSADVERQPARVLDAHRAAHAARSAGTDRRRSRGGRRRGEHDRSRA